MTSLQTLKDSVHARCAYVLFISGTGRAYTNEPELAGTSWVGATYGAWTVRQGLEPPKYSMGLDVQSGRLQTNNVTFEILDLDGDLASLMAAERPTEIKTLGEWIRPTHSHPGNGDGPETRTLSAVIVNGGVSIDLANKHVGLEFFGPVRQRDYFRPFPVIYPSRAFTQGHDHPVNANDPGGQTSPVYVTDNPLVYAGRLVTLWRIYYDPDVGTWKAWDPDEYPIWIGRMRDRGIVFTGGRKWKISCGGPESLLERALNRNTTHRWHPISAGISLASTGDREDMVAVAFWSAGDGGLPDTVLFDGSIFDTTNNLTGTDKGTITSQIDVIIGGAASGADRNYVGAGGNLNDYEKPAGGGVKADCQMLIGQNAGDVQVKKSGSSADANVVSCFLALHEKVWRLLGYEPQSQSGMEEDDPRRISFRKLNAGDTYIISPETVPGPGYWRGEFHTRMLGSELNDYNRWDNDGDWRTFSPLFGDGASVLDRNADHEILLSGAAGIIVEPQLIRPSTQVQVDGVDVEVNGLRYFVFRGKYYTAKMDEPQDMYQIGQCAVRTNGSYGTVADVGAMTGLYIVRWLDPIPHGINRWMLSTDWSSSNDLGDSRISCRPVAVLGSHGNNISDYAFVIWQRLMLTSGSSTGWSAYESAGSLSTIDIGENGHVYQSTGWDVEANDVEIADLGLAVPHELVDPPPTVRAEYKRAVGDLESPYLRQKIVLDGPVQSLDVLDGIMRPYGLVWSLYRGNAGGVLYGVVRLGPFSQSEVDETIGEADLATEDPPDQEMRATGPIDAIEMKYRYSPESESLAATWNQRALDSQSYYRSGSTKTEMECPGLIPAAWFLARKTQTMLSVTGAGPWEEEARRVLARELAEFYRGRHYMVTGLSVSRVKGQRLAPGCRVSLTNPWLISPTGSYGITDALGIVTRVDVNTDREVYRVSVLCFADSTSPTVLRYFAPVGRVKSYDDASFILTLYDDADFLDHGDDGLDEVDGFAQPSWASGSGNAVVRLYHYDRAGWVAGQTGTVSSVSAANRTITLTAALSATYTQRDRDTLVVLEAYDAQTASWVKNTFGVVVLDSGQFGATPTNGWQFH